MSAGPLGLSNRHHGNLHLGQSGSPPSNFSGFSSEIASSYLSDTNKSELPTLREIDRAALPPSGRRPQVGQHQRTLNHHMDASMRGPSRSTAYREGFDQGYPQLAEDWAESDLRGGSENDYHSADMGYAWDRGRADVMNASYAGTFDRQQEQLSPGERTPLPTVRGGGDHRRPSPKSRFWTPDVGVGQDDESQRPPTPSGDQTKGRSRFQKFFSSFRRIRSEAQPHAIPAAQSLQSGLTVKSETGSGAGRQEIPVRVLLLDGEEVTLKMDRQAMGHELMSRVCDGQDIIEYDYFGLTYTDKRYGTWFWLDLDKKIIKQISDTADWQFFFQVKFYPPEPAMLQDEITRYQLVLQVRQDVYTGKLPCSWVTQALLGSFVAQSEVGDYDPNLHHDTEYLKKFEFVRAPTEQLLQKISELHANNKGMKPAQSDMKYLETAKRLELYGLDLHPARDLENVEIYIGVGFSGVVIYRDRIRIGRFAWPKVLRISYKKENFFLKIRPDYAEPVEATVGFRLPNPHLAKRLWKSAVEHHAFFRLKEPRLQKHSPNGPFSLKLGSRHQYSGKTFFQYRTTNIDRPITDSERVQRGERAASVPASLNRAGLQYSSMHSLNRTHPRDMTIGKSTSRDYFGPTRAPPASLEEAGVPRTSRNPGRFIEQHPARDDSFQVPSRDPRLPPPRGSRPVDPDGSLFDSSSRGGGSLLGVRNGDYEEPRNVYPDSMLSGGDADSRFPSSPAPDNYPDAEEFSSSFQDQFSRGPPHQPRSRQAMARPQNGTCRSGSEALSYPDSGGLISRLPDSSGISTSLVPRAPGRRRQTHRAVEDDDSAEFPDYNPQQNEVSWSPEPSPDQPFYANLDPATNLSRRPRGPGQPRPRVQRTASDEDFL